MQRPGGGRAGAVPVWCGQVWLEHRHVHGREWGEAPAAGHANTGIPLGGGEGAG